MEEELAYSRYPANINDLATPLNKSENELYIAILEISVFLPSVGVLDENVYII